MSGEKHFFKHLFGTNASMDCPIYTYILKSLEKRYGTFGVRTRECFADYFGEKKWSARSSSTQYASLISTIPQNTHISHFKGEESLVFST